MTGAQSATLRILVFCHIVIFVLYNEQKLGAL